MAVKKISKKRADKKKVIKRKKRLSAKSPETLSDNISNAIEDDEKANFSSVDEMREKMSIKNIDNSLQDYKVLKEADDKESSQNKDDTDEQKDVDEKGTKMIVLSTINDISEVGKLHEKWQEHLSGPIMVIEASAVERMDTSVLQLLCALVKDADENGVDVEWKDPSEKLKHAVKLLGLNGPLKLH